jgi:cyanophycin synthetase
VAAPQRAVLIQLGHGKYQQRIQATVTGRTRTSRWSWRSDKEETNKILATLGLPVPKQELVRAPTRACAPPSASATRW